MQNIVRLIILIISISYSTKNLSFAYTTNNSINKKDTIIIKGDAYFPPFESINSNGEPEGFNIDLLKAIMQELNLPYKIELGDWHSAVSELRDGKIDLITSMMFTKDRTIPNLFEIGFVLSKAVSVAHH